MKVAIVKSNFYPDLSSGLFNGARQEFLDSGGLVENIKTFEVPGAFEVPSAVSKVLIHKSNYFDAVITLGVLVRGETDHYDHICRSVTDRISELSIESPIPIVYGILTVTTIDQAIERSDPNKKNKGAEVMRAAIEMINCFKKIK